MERAGTEVRPGRSQSLENACRWRSGEVRVIDLAWRLEGAHRSRRGTSAGKAIRAAGRRFGCGPDAVERAAGVKDADRLAPSHTFGLAHPLDNIALLATAEAVPETVVDVQPERGRTIEVAVGGKRAANHGRSGGAIQVDAGSPSYVDQGVAGAGGLDGERPHSPISIPLTGSSATGLSTCLLPSRYHWPRLSA